MDTLDERLAALKENATAADEIAVAICDLEGGLAEIEGTVERCDIFRLVWSLPRFNKAARRAILSGT